MTFALFAFVLFILVLMSAFFSASETAFTSVNKIRLKNYANEGNKKATRALKLLDDYDKLLTTILVGNNLVNILSSSICTWMFTMAFGALGVAFATVFIRCDLIMRRDNAEEDGEDQCREIHIAIGWRTQLLHDSIVSDNVLLQDGQQDDAHQCQ